MTVQFQPPPIASLPTIGEGKTESNNPVWIRWWLDLVKLLNITGGGGGLGFTHNALTGLDGGTTNEYFHLTSARYATITGNQSANIVFAGPATGAATAATFRSLVTDDLPSLLVAGGPTGDAATVPIITYNAKGQLTTVSTAAITPAAIGAPSGSGTSTGTNTGDNGTVTSVAVSGANGIGVSGSPITGAGTIALSLGAITPTSVSTPSIITASGALTVTPAAGSNFNLNLATTGDFAVNTNQLYVDTSSGYVGITASPSHRFTIGTGTTNTDIVKLINTTDSNGYVSIGFFNYLDVQRGGFGYGNPSAAAAFADRVYIYSIGGKDIILTKDQGSTISLSIQGSTGNVSVGTPTAVTIGNANKLQIAGTTAATNSLGISAWSADALGSRIELGKSRGAAIGTNTIVQSGDVVASVTGYGANGSTFTNLASISMEVDGTPGATNDMPGRIVFKTTPDASGTLTEAMRLNQDQTALFASSIKTSAPNTGTAAPWKLGTLVTGQVGLVMLSTQYLEVDVNGALVKLATI